MNRKRLYPVAGVLGVVLAAATVLVVGVIPPRTQVAMDPATVTPPQDEEFDAGDQPTGGPSEGIKVHGQWTIEVRDPDGTLVTRREFNNALSIPGALLLVRFLARTSSAGAWYIELANLNNQPCEDVVGTPVACLIVESTADPLAGLNNAFINLIVSVSNDIDAMGQTVHQLVLEGNGTAQRDGQISVVSTFQRACDSTDSPVACSGSSIPNATPMTQFVFGGFNPSVPVQTGQSILARVIISFS